MADALDDLSSEEPSPPIKPESEAREEEEEEEDEEESGFLPKVKTMWPPPASEQTEEDKPTKPIVRPTGASVLRKWPPANAKQETPKKEVKPATTTATIPTTATRLAGPKLSKKWPPEPTREEVPIAEKIIASKPVSPPPQEEKPVKQISPSPPPEVKRAVPLRSVKVVGSSQKQESQKSTELAAIKLRKADGKKVRLMTASHLLFVNT